MADRLTEQQLAAVNDRGRGLLVSAAAGSGKTKVLVERLFSYVEREGANLDEFLIITYTRAAAAELRGKIVAALNERLQNDPSDAHLQRQLLRVYRADIKTVDAFCAALRISSFTFSATSAALPIASLMACLPRFGPRKE
jgi:ATP-dependent helicase/nuclease subunit A